MSERRTIVGVQPWLPWPLSGWRVWAEPVRAERLAVLRIVFAAFLLLDILTTRLPTLHDFHGPDSLGAAELFDYLGEAPKWNWSLLRGFGDPLILSAAMTAWWVSTGLILLGLWGAVTATPRPGGHPLLRALLLVWAGATAAAVLGLWSRVAPGDKGTAELVWRAPLLAFGVAAVFWTLATWHRFGRGDESDPGLWWCSLVAVVVAGFFAGIGMWRFAQGGAPSPAWLAWAEQPWYRNAAALKLAMILWVAAVVLLLLGLGTRVVAVVSWVLMMSFTNINWYLDNAGDQVRGFILFYLMLSPCGAAWSLDSWVRRRFGKLPATPRYVSPWPLRLLFVQMMCIYFLNGVYKLMGADWLEGGSLYHVLCDVTLSRYSYALLPVPYWLTQAATWTVVTWEVLFPLLVAIKWTRPPALIFGVLFHLGILATMELGGFGMYMIALYVPLLPWDRWLDGRRPPDVELAPEEAAARAG